MVEVLPRTSVLERGDGGDKRARPIVANADLLVVVASVVEPPLRDRLIDRYLVAAALGDLAPAIVITKTTCRTTPRRSRDPRARTASSAIPC